MRPTSEITGHKTGRVMCKLVYSPSQVLVSVSTILSLSLLLPISNSEAGRTHELQAISFDPTSHLQAATANGSSTSGPQQQASSKIEAPPGATNSSTRLLEVDIAQLRDDSSQSFEQWKSQMDRHTYDVNATTPEADGSPQASVPRPAAAAAVAVAAPTATTNDTDEMETANSRFEPISIGARSDEELDTGNNYNANSATGASAEADEYADDFGFGFDGGASPSNLNEKKVVRELTRILSKGMSGATDQVKLETLESWKRRQRERKQLKDTRAKLFEDLLVAAIASHPERSRPHKSGGKRQPARPDSNSTNPKASSSSGSSALASLGLGGNADLDPDLSSDAETVIQHLQGLASAIDGHGSSSSSSSSSASSSSSSSSSSTGEPADNDHNSSDSGTGEQGAADSEAQSAEAHEPDERPRRPLGERPLARRFKKIKKQLSQRRKQLDQIKKLFNVELAINPKDGSLMSRPAGKTKKKTTQAHHDSSKGYIDYTEDEPPGGFGSKSSASSGSSKQKRDSRATELMAYLRENPEILASVMAELTFDAEPASSLPSSSSRLDDGPPPSRSKSSAASSDDLSYLLSSSSGGSGRRSKSHHRHQLADSDSLPAAWEHRARRHQRLRGELSSGGGSGDTSDLPPPLASSLTGGGGGGGRRVHHRSRSVDSLLDRSESIPPRQPRTRSAEDLLLESLRERQLLNLARLDMVLAEKQSTSNRSGVFSSGADGSSSLGAHQQPSSLAGANAATRHDYDQRPPPTAGNKNQSPLEQGKNGRYEAGSTSVGRNQTTDEEVFHHFMVVNPNVNETSPFSRPMGIDTFAPGPIAPTSPFTPSGQMYPSSSSSNGSPNNGYQQYSPPTVAQTNGSRSSSASSQLQQAAPALKRFRDWRDVGQSEASSTHFDRMNVPSGGGGTGNNPTSSPYDLTTGSSSRAIEAQLQSNLRHQKQRPFMSADMTTDGADRLGGTATSSDGQPLGGISQQSADSSITRPGPPSTPFMAAAQNAPPYQPAPPFDSNAFQSPRDNPAHSLFMTRSSVSQQPNSADAPLKPEPTRSDSGDSLGSRTSQGQEDESPRGDTADDPGYRPPFEHATGANEQLQQQQDRSAANPVDYFSSYKQEMPTSVKRKARQPQESSSAATKVKQRRLATSAQASSDQADLDGEGMGAMWAK